MRRRSRPYLNVVSVLTPFVGIALGIPFGLLVVWATNGHPAAMAKPWAGCYACFVVVGLLSGCIALARSERLWGITVVGLAMNAALLAHLVWWAPWDWPF